MQCTRFTTPIFSAILLGVAGLSACEDPAPTSRSAGQVDAATAALVNGDPIYISDVELEAAAQGLIEPGGPFGPDHPDFQPVLEQLIDQRLLAQEAVRRGLDLETAARRRLEAGRERLLGNILVENLVANEVTDDAIESMYAEQVKLQQLDDEVRLRHILVETKDEADSIAGELSDGTDFTELAFKHSIDIRTRIDGGNFGWVAPNDMMDPFPAIIGDTETGSMSAPFESEQGWHILRVDERRTRPPKTKEEMRPEIITFLTFTQISDILRELRTNADIRQRNPGDAAVTPAIEDDAAAVADETTDTETP
ncbi:MAG: peptidylprolyl isomerase [Henriciella sp.]|nr:peptidylprolyl isomerase [Henriciella sp.]